MKKHLLTIFTLILSFNFLFAQLPPGSTAPDWTEQDLDGVTHHLYDYLDGEQVVFS